MQPVLAEGVAKNKTYKILKQFGKRGTELRKCGSGRETTIMTLSRGNGEGKSMQRAYNRPDSELLTALCCMNRKTEDQPETQ